MIKSLHILAPEKSHIAWLSSNPPAALAKPRKFDFGSGINIFVGQNGTGKSTVLKILAQAMHCEQGGRSVVTSSSINDLYLDHESGLEAYSIEHDGQAVFHFDSSHTVGLIGGMAGFDDDFLEDGFCNAMYKGSNGQTILNRLNGLLTDILFDNSFEIEYRASLHKKGAKVRKFLKGTIEKGPRTILLDEPDRGLDLRMQRGLWRLFRDIVAEGRNQIIIASHSPFAFRIPEATYHEFGNGYLDHTCNSIVSLPDWSDYKVDSAHLEKLKKDLKNSKPGWK